jgi:hypothetical protein
MCHSHGSNFRDKLLANHNELMHPLFFIERATKRKFARHLQVKVYHKGCYNGQILKMDMDFNNNNLALYKVWKGILPLNNFNINVY